MGTAEVDNDAALRSTALQPIGVVGGMGIFGAAGLLLWGVTHGLIPAVAARSGAEPVLLWFLFAGLGVFLPLVVAAHVILLREGRRAAWSSERLRFRRPTRNDWLWSAAALVAIGLLTVLSVAAVSMFSEEAPLQPSFLRMEPLGLGRYWILAAWLPFWVLNIASEELLWRGVLLPRQEVALGRAAWIANGAGWLLFHLPFGPMILLPLWPTAFILPYVVQRTKNSSAGVLIHAGLNGPAFLAVAFGLV
ncbi:MAG TPA: CPBP family intramembrane glutamic endopeptidase [Chthoniobacterales bacterium]